MSATTPGKNKPRWRRLGAVAVLSTLIGGLMAVVTPVAANAALPPECVNIEVRAAIPAFDVAESKSYPNDTNNPLNAEFTVSVEKTFTIQNNSSLSVEGLAGKLKASVSTTITSSTKTTSGQKITTVVPPHSRLILAHGVESFDITYDEYVRFAFGGVCQGDWIYLGRKTVHAPTIRHRENYFSPPVDDSVYPLRSVHSGKCADVQGVSPDNGAPIYQIGCHGGGNQQWRMTARDDGTYTVAALHSGKCLAVSGHGINSGDRLTQWGCDGLPNQRWTLHPTSTAGAYRLTAAHSGMCMEVAGASTADAAYIQQWPCYGATNQLWRIGV